MEKIVINLEASLERLSSKALRLLAERTGAEYETIARLHFLQPNALCFNRGPIVDIVEELGEEANGEYACLVVVEVPDHYHGVIERRRGGAETVKFQWKEDYLRKLIQLGNEDDIVNYVRGKLY